jgi:hypothetical protein
MATSNLGKSREDVTWCNSVQLGANCVKISQLSKNSTEKLFHKQCSDPAQRLLIGWIHYAKMAWRE